MSGAPYSRVCSRCRETFFPDDREARPLYCGNTCARASQNGRRQWRALHGEGYCPTPFKRRYLSVEEADNVVEGEAHAGTNPYRCACGAIHIGHRDNEAKAGVGNLVDVDTLQKIRDRLDQFETEAEQIRDIQDDLTVIKDMINEIEDRLNKWDALPWYRAFYYWLTGKGLT